MNVVPFFHPLNEMLPTISLVDRRIRTLVDYYGKHLVVAALSGSAPNSELEMHMDNLKLTYGDIVEEYYTLIYQDVA